MHLRKGGLFSGKLFVHYPFRPSFSNLAIIVTVPSVVTCALCVDSYDALFPFLRIIKLECEREKLCLWSQCESICLHNHQAISISELLSPSSKNVFHRS